jgi:hypothetical protein
MELSIEKADGDGLELGVFDGCLLDGSRSPIFGDDTMVKAGILGEVSVTMVNC